VDPDALLDTDPFLSQLGQAYMNYRETLSRNNRVDFAQQQKLVHDLLLNADFLGKIAGTVR
jgi:hypothetical protein